MRNNQNSCYAYNRERKITCHGKSSKLLIVFALILSCTLFIPGITNATTHYINGTSGNDANDGSQSSPWKTIAKANSTLVAGDNVYIEAGTYRETIQPVNSGTYGNYITYARLGTDEVVITRDKLNTKNVAYGAILTGRDYIELDGLTIKDFQESWIEMKPSSYCIIKNCTFGEYFSFCN